MTPSRSPDLNAAEEDSPVTGGPHGDGEGG